VPAHERACVAPLMHLSARLRSLCTRVVVQERTRCAPALRQLHTHRQLVDKAAAAPHQPPTRQRLSVAADTSAATPCHTDSKPSTSDTHGVRELPVSRPSGYRHARSAGRQTARSPAAARCFTARTILIHQCCCGPPTRCAISRKYSWPSAARAVTRSWGSYTCVCAHGTR
jgi:hypothetical protein